MIEQQGRVIEVLSLQARIEVGPAEGCSRCASGKGCGAGLFVRLINRKPTKLLVDSTEPLHIGQRVTIGISERLFLSWVARLYGLPLLAAFAVAIPVQLLAGKYSMPSGLTDLTVLLAAIAGFTGTLFLSRRQLNNGAANTSLHLLNNHPSPDSVDCAANN